MTHGGTDRRHPTGDFMPRDMRQTDVGIVPHPSVPVAATNPTSPHLDHGGIVVSDRRRDLANPRLAAELFE